MNEEKKDNIIINNSKTEKPKKDLESKKVDAVELTESEKMQARIERYDAQAAELKARADKLKSELSEKKRNEEKRIKIIIGAAVQSYLLKSTDAERASLISSLCLHLSEKDQKFLGWSVSKDLVSK